MVNSLPEIFFVLLAVSVLSALFLLYPRVPLTYVRLHVGFTLLPPLAALLILFTTNETTIYGPWLLDSLSWLLVSFVLIIGFIVQRYSVRYFLGDRSYRKYFALLTLTTSADSVVWLCNDLRLLLICWGTTLLGLILLIRVKKEWSVARNAAKQTGKLFAISWIILFGAVLWVTQSTGHLQLSLVLTKSSLTQLGLWERTCISLMLILAVVIPAAQWPFHRWLLNTVVAPTPVSAVMHAGLVNAGGMILTRFSPLFSGNMTQIILLILSSVSVMIGTGIMLVQVDYKRQLVGSTIAQMGFMFIQCALGAFSAAIIHAILHGLFKSTLFLQSGSALDHHKKQTPGANQPRSLLWTITGGILGLLATIGLWLSSSGENYQFISALTLGWSVSLAWTQLVAFGNGHIARIAGFSLVAVAAIVYHFVHDAFYGVLQNSIPKGIQPPEPAAILLLIILLAGSAAGVWLARHRSSTAYSVIYLWLVRLGEPQSNLIESHPKYLTKSFFKGGHLQ
ncbi:NADH dehydrogenase subunit 5 [Neobacillus sp. MM2021_6]|uniref:NADH dehydrogenase subunit 5 n=1 Tax=Bacillaceae TaxID=186817 RepID=UPI00140D9354|nr:MULTISPECIES: NADH dehydrogenase subunit 5 [Bacillaceae]MBO0962421.1 NADH dehydrogenase subunit 5 [Neobacillus sp. MM2021_6]NHC18907.1 NADH dehydrogenase subunit 5 [Bacillus sp. MM2020_4]